MPRYRSHRTTQGRTRMAARALWRATRTAEADLAKPIVAIANSYTQFVPGHVHLKPLGELVAEEIHRAGAVTKEFHTIAVDDGIAMGHEGMLYSLPSRELIADAGRIHGQRPLRGRSRVHLQLRQDHAGNAHGRPSPEPADHLRLRRPETPRGGARCLPDVRLVEGSQH